MTKYDAIDNYYEGLCGVVRNKLCGFIDTEGNEVIPLVYKNITNFVDGIANVTTTTDDNIYINYRNQRVEDMIYMGEYEVEICYTGDKVSLLHTITGNTIVSPGKYNDIVLCDNGLATVGIRDRYGFIECDTGKEIVPCIYSFIGEFYEGLCDVFKADNLFGFIDRFGKVQIPFIYDDVYMGFSEGLCAVKKGKLWGFIDKYNKIIVDFMYDDTKVFSEGICVVKRGTEWFHINKKGERV